jgi:UDP-apiose/xylose synthase
LLRDPGYEVEGLDLTDEKLEEALLAPKFKFVRGDIRRERETTQAMIDRADVVVDLIAHANPSLYVAKPLEVFELNFTENLHIAEACVEKRKRLVQFSTCEVYGKTLAAVAPDMLQDPDDPRHAVFSEDATDFILGPVNKHRWIYSCAKQLLERVIHAYGIREGLNWTVVRPFNFIGPKIDYLTTALIEGSQMKLVNGGHNKRCYTYIGDAVDCIERIIANPDGVCDREIFNVGSPQNELSIRELAERMRELYARKFRDPGQRLPDIVDVDSRDFYGEGYEDSDRRIPDITKARTLLGWQPKYGLDETIERSMAGFVPYSSTPAP